MPQFVPDAPWAAMAQIHDTVQNGSMPDSFGRSPEYPSGPVLGGYWAKPSPHCVSSLVRWSEVGL